MNKIEQIELLKENIFEVNRLAEILDISETSIYRQIAVFHLNAILIGDKRIIITKADCIAMLKDCQINERDFTYRDAAYEMDIITKVLGDKYKNIDEEIGMYQNCGNQLLKKADIFFGIQELSLKLKVSATHIRNIIERGDLKAERILKQYRIYIESLREYLKKNQTFNQVCN
ncbi:MAG TPA: helix-turn-helix domain-containing protein [bacterium]|nr:helix-turn-helix domain-containing protein [bacterium]HPN32526.1 helix-turn-helix domain-containing protein [bacterium]